MESSQMEHWHQNMGNAHKLHHKSSAVFPPKAKRGTRHGGTKLRDLQSRAHLVPGTTCPKQSHGFDAAWWTGWFYPKSD